MNFKCPPIKKTIDENVQIVFEIKYLHDTCTYKSVPLIR